MPPRPPERRPISATINGKFAKIAVAMLTSLEELDESELAGGPEADKDRDGCISFEEFATAMEKTDIEQKMSIRSQRRAVPQMRH